VTSILLVGAGAVAARTTRQLLDTAGIDRVSVLNRDSERAAELVDAFSNGDTRVRLAPEGDPLRDVAAVVLAAPGAYAVRLAAAAVERSRPVVAVADDEETMSSLLALDPLSREHGVVVAVGCGLAPGLSDVLARHAANALERVDELHVARAGVAGPTCVETLRRAHHSRPLEWRDGAWHRPRRSGPELVWFPDPVGATECEPIAAGAPLLLAAVPGVERLSVRAAVPPLRATGLARLSRRAVTDVWGAVRVEAWGWKDERRSTVVYGLLERPAIAAGVTLAVVAAALVGALPAVERHQEAGAHGLGRLVSPPSLLAELANRGVRAATFEGVGVG